MKSLKSFNISSKAFQSAKSFELRELEALETVEIGENCFNSVDSFSLIGIIEWTEWQIDLPLLQSVKLGYGAFSGDYYRDTIDEYPYNYNNTMIMRSNSNWLNVY